MRSKPNPPRHRDTSGFGAVPIIVGGLLIPAGIPAAVVTGGVVGATGGAFGGGVLAGLGMGALIGGGIAVGGITAFVAVTMGCAFYMEWRNKKDIARYKEQLRDYERHAQKELAQDLSGPAAMDAYIALGARRTVQGRFNAQVNKQATDLPAEQNKDRENKSDSQDDHNRPQKPPPAP